MSVLLVAVLALVMLVTGRWAPAGPPSPAVLGDRSDPPAVSPDPVAGRDAPGTPAAAAPAPKGTPGRRSRATTVQPTAADSKAPQVRQAYGFEVASSADADSAATALRRIAKRSRLPCRIVVKPSGDAYRVVVGPFSERRDAERAIRHLFRTGLIDRARLVQIAEQEAALIREPDPRRR